MKWLHDHVVQVHLICFGLMFLLALGLYYAAQSNDLTGILGLLTLVVVGNVLVLVA